MVELLRDRRFLLAVALFVVVAAAFWSGTRYPQLSDKAAMGGDVDLEDPLGFEAVLTVERTDPFLTKVSHTTVNWLHTNQRGMAFGVLIAAAFMTVLPRLRNISFEGAIPNTLLGVILGAPLGVCVNCAAPIARGLHASGARIETTLATMISSPSLNVVVLAMLFSLFPPYVALLKLGFTLSFIVVMIPTLSRFAFRTEQLSARESGRLTEARSWPPPSPDDALDARDVGWGAALRWVGRHYLRNLWFIARYTVPLMFLAGLLGALAVTAVPLETVADAVPQRGGLLVAGMAAAAFIGLLLPVPIAFDVVVSAALLAGGVPVTYVMLLLFTLGIFSIYSFLIIWDSMSLRVAATLAVTLFVWGMGAGAAVEIYVRWERPRQQRMIFEAFEKFELPDRRLGEHDPPREAASLIAELSRDALRWEPVSVESPGDIAVVRTAFDPKRAASDALFTREYGDRVGLERIDDVPAIYKLSTPYYRNWPIAAGDVHADGRVDVVLGSDHGPQLYANRGAEGFVRQRIEVDALQDAYAANLALVDLDGDGWLDLFISTYRRGNHIVYNAGGHFEADNHVELPAPAANLANAMAFGDLDRDGDLDIVLGNWTAGPWTRYSPEASRNVVLWNEGRSFREEPLPGMIGETLSTLLSDINLDGKLDLLVGNDFAAPDIFYLSNGDTGFEPLWRDNGIIPHSTNTTMSLDSADIDNDLDLDVYIGQITGRGSSQENDIAWRNIDEICETELDDPRWLSRCEDRMRQHESIKRGLRAGTPARCMQIEDASVRADCIAWFLLLHAVRAERDRSLCDRIPERWEPLAFICRQPFQRRARYPDSMWRRALPQVRRRNVLLVSDAGGGFTDQAEERGVGLGGWTWNARFADYDNDEWQDLYVVNGAWSLARREPNVYYANQAGRSFVDATEAAGLGSYLATVGFVSIDVDNDGDLDIVEVTADGPIWLHRNGSHVGRAIAFELDDARGNRFGIGSKIVIRYGPNGKRQQVRELKSSGGFISFDAPGAHFGLGGFATVHRVEVTWSTGETSVLSGDFAAGHRYRISRSTDTPPPVRRVASSGSR